MTPAADQPEVWLRGKIAGVSNALMPVVHALLQARRELRPMQEHVSIEECRISPGGAATIGFHLAHIVGSLDRLFCYAHGTQLSAAQLAYLRDESRLGAERSPEALFEAAVGQIDACVEQLRTTAETSLLEARAVGRDRLPSTVMGLVFHAAEHTTMHVGQIRTTLKIIRGVASAAPVGNAR